MHSGMSGAACYGLSLPQRGSSCLQRWVKSCRLASKMALRSFSQRLSWWCPLSWLKQCTLGGNSLILFSSECRKYRSNCLSLGTLHSTLHLPGSLPQNLPQQCFLRATSVWKSKLQRFSLHLMAAAARTESQWMQLSAVLKQARRLSCRLNSSTKPQPSSRNMLLRLPYFIRISSPARMVSVARTWQYRSRNFAGTPFAGALSSQLSLSLPKPGSSDQARSCWTAEGVGSWESVTIWWTLSLRLEWFIMSKMGMRVYSLVYPKERLLMK